MTTYMIIDPSDPYTMTADDLEQFRDAVEVRHAVIMDCWRGDPETKAAADAQRSRLLALIDSRAVDLGPHPMDTAPRDGTMVRLLVQFEENATEDTAEPAWTVGACNDDNVGDDEKIGWQFAGWCWTHDHFTDGKGKPVGWLPLVSSAQAVGLTAAQAVAVYDAVTRRNFTRDVKSEADKARTVTAALTDSQAVSNG